MKKIFFVYKTLKCRGFSTRDDKHMLGEVQKLQLQLITFSYISLFGGWIQQKNSNLPRPIPGYPQIAN